MDHAHYQLWLKRVLNPAFWQFFSGHCLGLTQKPWLCFQGRIAIANFSPKNVVMSTTFLGVVFFTCYFFPIFYVNAWGDDPTLPFDIFLNRLLASFPHLLGDDFKGTWRDFFMGISNWTWHFSPHFQKKNRNMHFGHVFPPPPPFFWVKFLIFSQRTRHFPEWGLWSSSGPSDSQCPSFCSSRPPMPPRRGTVNGGVVNKFSPNNSGVKHRCFSGTKKEWHSFCSHPK